MLSPYCRKTSWIFIILYPLTSTSSEDNKLRNQLKGTWVDEIYGIVSKNLSHFYHSLSCVIVCLMFVCGSVGRQKPWHVCRYHRTSSGFNAHHSPCWSQNLLFFHLVCQDSCPVNTWDFSSHTTHLAVGAPKFGISPTSLMQRVM